MRDELNVAVIKEIKYRYQQGIAYLTMFELPEAQQLWKSRDSLGIESVQIAMERVIFDESKNDFVDGIATGSRGDSLDWGFYWSSKLSDQIFDNAFEFGSPTCKNPMLTEDEKEFLANQLIDQDIARFVFIAMKHIALARANQQHELNLANHWYFCSLASDAGSGFIERSAAVLRNFLEGRGYQIDVLSIRQGILRKKPELSGGLDIIIRWKKRQF